MRKNILRLRKEEQNKGFTLVELIVVIAITLILAGGLVFGISKWVEWTQFKQQNEYARTLFTAAQNQLTEYSSSGQLEELKTNVEQASTKTINLFIESLKNSDGNSYDLNTVFPQSSGKTRADRYQDKIYSIIGTAADYKKYQALKTDEDAKNDPDNKLGADVIAMYDMFSQYLYDPSILNATICVEFTADDGQVFAVLYSNKDTGFEYNESNTNHRGTVNITNRQISYRKARMTGYYGVDQLYKATSNNTEKPVLADVKLNNEDTLNLSFTLSKVKSAAQNMTYEIAVCDKTTKNARLVITMDGTEIKSEAMKKPIECDVVRYDYDESGSKKGTTKLGTYNILAWIDNSETIRVILDAADLAATSSAYYDAYVPLMTPSGKTDGSIVGGEQATVSKIKSTYSFHRFGINVEDIFCTIQGSGKDYKTTAKRQTNSENAYMGSIQSITEGENTKATYSIKNARHLYNMRYMEDYSEKERSATGYEGLKTADQVIYQVTNNIDWSAFATASLYKAGALVTDAKEEVFPSIKQLRSNMTMESASNKIYTLSGLVFTETMNAQEYVYGVNDTTKDKVEKGPIGLFVINKGNIASLNLDKVTSTGTNYVGTFCGENAGTLSKLEVKNTKNASTVIGNYSVGGITGGQNEDAKEVSYKNLINRASIIGKQSVGGIIGSASSKGAEKDMEIDSCSNYGRLSLPEEVAAKDGTYIGGIAGYVEAEADHKFTIRNCKSSPQYTDAELKDILSSEENLGKKLKGTYVGGIVGFVDGATITNCNTKRESTSTNGYIFGYTNVGGIVGGSSGTDLKLEGGTNNNVNEAYVLAYSHAGGILGSGNDTTTVIDWENRAMVAVQKEYAGGIVGYNTGTLQNCSSDAENTTQATMIRNCQFLRGSYIGGIAGYNNGKMYGNTDESAESNTVIAYTAGKDFVGGIVGYNDEAAEVTNYQVAGGYVTGTGSYIGGYAGCNRSEQLLASQSLVANPNEVSGKYCVGGVIGGNVVSSKEAVTTYFSADNFLGRLTATAFGGGFIGYNQIIGENDREKIQAAIAKQTEKLDQIDDLKEAVNEIALAGYESTVNASNVQMTIDGRDTASLVSHSRFEGITGQIYVAGVVGYNDEDSHLYIKNITNLTPVTAEAAITNSEEQPDRMTYLESEFAYSYAGGIIGKVGANTTLDNCQNEDVGDVTAPLATYRGALCEINEGTIMNCSVSSIGGNNVDYVGGIAGLNKAGATITACKFTDRTVMGSNYVGGFAAENFGTIENSSIENGTVTAYGTQGYVGGITSYNYEGGQIILNSDASLDISATNDNVGGIAGCNKGTIETSKEADKSAAVKGSVLGNKNVGGIIGQNLSSGNVTDFCNEAVVTATSGNAGGIVGVNQTASIANCVNNGMVSATEAGDAGGIVAENSGTINYCGDHVRVTAANGNCGGITGINNSEGRIVNSQVNVPAAGNDDWWGKLQNWIRVFIGTNSTITFDGMDNVGGICGKNAGAIGTSKVEDLIVTNTAKSGTSNIGAITGENTGTISLSNVAVSSCSVETYTSGSNVGGVAGRNAGTINGSGSIEAKVGFKNGGKAVYANLGGVAGINASGCNISGCTVTGNITGDMGTSESGYGGISGVNNGTITESSFDGSLLANGSSDNMVNMGGIAGLSQGSVSKCIVGIKAKTTISSGTTNGDKAAGYVGGMVGWNYGSVTESDNEKGSDAIVSVVNYAGHTGGIVGYNMAGAMVTGTSAKNLSTGKKWTVASLYYSNDCGCGGIMGYSASGNSIAYVENYADVTANYNASNVTAGGMVGRLENKENAFFTISNSKNYGAINSKALSGGFIGRIKYKPCIIQDSENYGNVDNTISGTAGGGFIGSFYLIDANSEIDIIRCKNFGAISASTTSGGILGATDNTVPGTVKVIVSDSVNEGCIKGGTAAGIAANASNFSLYLYQCRNYGNSTNSNFSGIASAGYKAMNDCLSISNQKRVANGGSNNNIFRSYYLNGEGVAGATPTPTPTVSDTTVYYAGTGSSAVSAVKTTGTSISATSGNPVSYMYGSGNDEQRVAFDAGSEVKATVSSTAVDVTFKYKQQNQVGPYLKHMGIYWGNGGSTGNVRKYTFTISCLANGKNYYLARDSKWVEDPVEAYTFAAYGCDKSQNSFWGTKLDGKLPIDSITAHVTEVANGSFNTSGDFVQGTGASAYSKYVCFYGTTAAVGANDYTSTVDAVFKAEGEVATAREAVTDKQSAADEANKKLDEAKSVVEKAKKVEDDAHVAYNKAVHGVAQGNSVWNISATSGTSKTSNLFTNISGTSWERATLSGKTMKLTLTPKDANNLPSVSNLRILWAGNSDKADYSNNLSRRYSYTITVTYEDNTTKEISATNVYGYYYDKSIARDYSDSIFTDISGIDKSKKVKSIVISSTVTGSGKAEYNENTHQYTNSTTGWDDTYSQYVCLWGVEILNDAENQPSVQAAKKTWDEARQALEDAEKNDNQAEIDKLQKEYDAALKELETAQTALANAEKKLEQASYFTGTLSTAGRMDVPPAATPTPTPAATGTPSTTAYGAPMVVTTDTDGKYNLVTNIQGTIPDLTNNPLTAFQDSTAYVESVDESIKGQRQKVYEDVDPKTIDYYKKLSNVTDPKIPNSLKVTSSGNNMRLSFVAGSIDYYQHQVVYIVRDKDQNVIVSSSVKPDAVSYGVLQYSLTLDDKWIGHDYNVTFYVRAINGNYSEAGYGDGSTYGPITNTKQEGASLWVKSDSTTILQPQPIPKVHLELEGYNNENMSVEKSFVAVLENATDYADDTEKTTITLSFDMDFKNKNGQSTRSITFDAETGRSESFTFNNGTNGNQVMSVKAESNSTHFASVTSSVQSAIYSAYAMKNTNYIAATFNDFYGDLMSNLYNQLQMKSAHNSTELYMNTELVVKDYKFKDSEGTVLDNTNIDLVVTSGNSHITQNAGTMTSNLSGLPQDMLDYKEVTVRAYPWRSQAYLCWYGHSVASGITEETLESYINGTGELKDAEAEDRKVFITNEQGVISLAPGYVLRMTSENQYEIIYSSILANDQDYSTNAIKQKTYTITDEKVESISGYNKKIQPKPVIEEAYEQSADNNSYTFTWDKEKAEENAKYNLQLTGTTLDNKTVLLETVSVDKDTAGSYVAGADKCWKYTFTDVNANWNYTKLTLEVTRVGTIDSVGATTVFPSTATKDFAVKLRFSTISRPVAALHKDETVAKNSLDYDVTWTGVPKAEVTTDLSGYEITLKRADSDADNADSEAKQYYSDMKAYNKELSRLDTLYTSKEGCTKTADTATITYQWKEVDANKTDYVNKTMVLNFGTEEKDGTNQYYIIKSLTEQWFFAITEEERSKLIGSDTFKKELDLNEFERGEKIDISVRAIAVDASEIYRSGADGIVREMQLPSRLEVPDVDSVKETPEYAADNSITIASYTEDGLTLTMTDNQTQAIQGKYQIAAAIYSDRAVDDWSKVAEGDDNWNAGAEITLWTKADETTMTGNLNNGEITLTSSEEVKLEDYAGQWMKIALRAVSDSNVSSWWTDEDNDALTLNYQWIQIPRAQVDTPQIVTSNKTLYYRDTEWNQNTIDGTTTVDDLPVIQTCLSFEQITYADMYKVQLLRAAASDVVIDQDKNYNVQYVDWIYIEKGANGENHVFYTTTDPTFDPTIYRTQKAEHPEAIPDCEQDSNAVYLGDTTEYLNGYCQLPYKQVARENVLDSSKKVNVVSYIQKTAIGFDLVLPDAESVGEYVDSSFLFTTQATTQARVSERNVTRYADSQVDNWYRKNDGTTDIQVLTEDEKLEALNSLSYTTNASERSDTAYEIQTTAAYRLLYDIQILDESGNLVEERYISAYANGDTSVDNVALLSDSIYAQYAGMNMRLRAAAVIKVSTDADGTTHGALSQWTNWTTAQPLPALVVAVPQITGGTTTISGSTVDGSIQDVAAHAYTWEQQVKAKSYGINVESNTYDTAAYPLGTTNLAEISITDGTSPVTVTPTLQITQNGDVYSYTLTVPDAVASLSIQAIPQDDHYTADTWNK